MRVAVALKNTYPRKFVWFMECDVCRQTVSDPAWSQADLPLSMFRDLGWSCKVLGADTCPKCLGGDHE